MRKNEELKKEEAIKRLQEATKKIPVKKLVTRKDIEDFFKEKW